MDALEGPAFIMWMAVSCTLSELPVHSPAFLQPPTQEFTVKDGGED